MEKEAEVVVVRYVLLFPLIIAAVLTLKVASMTIPQIDTWLVGMVLVIGPLLFGKRLPMLQLSIVMGIGMGLVLHGAI